MKASIIYIAQGDYWSSRYSFESIGFLIKEKEVEFIIKDAPKEYIKTIGESEVELFVIDLTNDEKTFDYFNKIATEVISTKELNSQVYNSIFRKISHDYVCMIPSGLFLQKDWLTELYYFYVNVNKSGVVGIADDLEELDFIPLPNNELIEFINVFVSKNNLIKGLSFFHKQHLYLVGAFDDSLQLHGNELNHFSLRCMGLGLYNYYIPSVTCIFNSEGKYINPDLFYKGETDMKKSLSEMRKIRNYYIAL